MQKEFIQSLQVTLCVPSKQPRTIKTIIYKDIFTSLRRKKVQNPAKQLKELFGLVCYFFALNQPSSVLNYLKTSFILTNQDWVIFSCTLSAQKLVYFTLLPDIFFVEVQFFKEKSRFWLKTDQLFGSIKLPELSRKRGPRRHQTSVVFIKHLILKTSLNFLII